MTTTQISRGGQISIPAKIRRRWQTRNLMLEDRGDEIVLRPEPADPIAAAAGSLAIGSLNSDQLRAASREDDAAAEQRRTPSLGER
ncbi:MAG: AbrB/MazE/SpoVT family DNA-binding domain-containing protein [Mycobacteriales bacterium]